MHSYNEDKFNMILADIPSKFSKSLNSPRGNEFFGSDCYIT